MRSSTWLIGLCLAVGALSQSAPLWASEPSDWGTQDRVWEFIGQAQTESDEACLQEIATQAVFAATGRFYFGEEMLLARDLLQNYLKKYSANFIASKNVLERRQAGKRITVRARANVLVDRLFSDLKEKRFIYAPKSNPFFYVFLNDTIDGAEPQDPVSRPLIEKALDDKGLARLKQPLPAPPATVDVTAKADLLAQARRAAQEHEVEVLLSGAISTNQLVVKKLYYKDETFYESKIVLHLIRVDDGKILHTAEKSIRVARAKGTAAMTEAIGQVCEDAAQKALDFFTANWAKTVREGAQYRVMLTDVSEEEAQAFAKQLAALDPSVKVYPHNYFGRVAVMNFDYEGDAKVLDVFFRKVSSSRFRIVPHGEGRFELQTLRG